MASRDENSNESENGTRSLQEYLREFGIEEKSGTYSNINVSVGGSLGIRQNDTEGNADARPSGVGIDKIRMPPDEEIKIQPDHTAGAVGHSSNSSDDHGQDEKIKKKKKKHKKRSKEKRRSTSFSDEASLKDERAQTAGGEGFSNGQGGQWVDPGFVGRSSREDVWEENKIDSGTGADAYIARRSSVSSNAEVSTLLDGQPLNGMGDVEMRKRNNVQLGSKEKGNMHAVTFNENQVEAYTPQSIDGPFDKMESTEIKEDEIEDEKDLLGIPPDSFSMFFVASSRSQHVLPLCIFSLQMIVLSLILHSLRIQRDRQVQTPLNVPVAVAPIVTWAQYFACLICVYTADDFVSGILLVRASLVRGVGRPSSIGIARRGIWSRLLCCGNRSGEVNISKKWDLSNAMRMSVGIFVIIVSFFFIVQSENVIDLFLNFAAVAFVSELDDALFLLSEKGFFGEANKRLAEKVGAVKVNNSTLLPTAAERNNEDGRCKSCRCGSAGGIRKRFKSARILIFATVTLSMWIGLTTIVSRQKTQSLMCQSVSVTFDDSEISLIRHLNGIYDIHESFQYYGFPIYFQRQGGGTGNYGYYIAYCGKGVNRWVIGHWEESDPNSLGTICGAIAFSRRTQTYDITQVENINYYLDTSVQGGFVCNDCNPRLEQMARCSGRGTCNEKNKRCECSPGLWGASCEFGPCTEVEVQGDEMTAFGRMFHLMYDPEEEERKILLVHDRPVYYQKLDSTNWDGLILFDGGRWQVVRTGDLVEFNNATDDEEVVDEADVAIYLRDDFHAGFSNFDTWFVSDSTQKGTPSDVPFRAWLTSAGDASSSGTFGEEEHFLFCADCQLGSERDEEYNMKTDFASVCVNKNGSEKNKMCLMQESEKHGPITRCQCDPGFEGVLCSTRPFEGTIELYMNQNNVCSSCYKGDVYVTWYLDGIGSKCDPFPWAPLIFDLNGTLVYRQLLLNLNTTHFSLMISDSKEWLNPCNYTMGFKVLNSFHRDISQEQIQVNYAVHLEPTNNFTGSIVDEQDIDCPIETRIDSRTCRYDLQTVFLSSPTNQDNRTNVTTSLSSAWIHLDVQVTPIR